MAGGPGPLPPDSLAQRLITGYVLYQLVHVHFRSLSGLQRLDRPYQMQHPLAQ